MRKAVVGTEKQIIRMLLRGFLETVVSANLIALLGLLVTLERRMRGIRHV